MKNLKLISVAAFCIITAMLLSSCGIMKKNDFSTRKYTHFKRGESTVNIKRVPKEKKDANLYAMVSGKNKEVIGIAPVAVDKVFQTVMTSIPEMIKQSGKTFSQSNINPKETKKPIINRTFSFVRDRLTNKSTAASYHHDDGLSLFWLVILILLILWAIGLASGGFGLGGLINVLLVIALVLLILWLLHII